MYVVTLQLFVTVPLNSVGLAVVAIGCWTVGCVASRLSFWLVREAPLLGVVLTVIVRLRLQTAFTAVETRFGIIVACAVSGSVVECNGIAGLLAERGWLFGTPRCMRCWPRVPSWLCRGWPWQAWRHFSSCNR